MLAAKASASGKRKASGSGRMEMEIRVDNVDELMRAENERILADLQKEQADISRRQAAAKQRLSVLNAKARTVNMSTEQVNAQEWYRQRKRRRQLAQSGYHTWSHTTTPLQSPPAAFNGQDGRRLPQSERRMRQSVSSFGGLHQSYEQDRPVFGVPNDLGSHRQSFPNNLSVPGELSVTPDSPFHSPQPRMQMADGVNLGQGAIITQPGQRGGGEAGHSFAHGLLGIPTRQQDTQPLYLPQHYHQQQQQQQIAPFHSEESDIGALFPRLRSIDLQEEESEQPIAPSGLMIMDDDVAMNNSVEPLSPTNYQFPGLQSGFAGEHASDDNMDDNMDPASFFR